MIALDLDGTIADTKTTLNLFICSQLGLDAQTHRDALHRIPDYHKIEDAYPEHLRADVKQLIRRAFSDNEGYVYDDAPSYFYWENGQAKLVSHLVNKLNKMNMFAGYVTYRLPTAEAATREWLSRYEYPLDKPLIFAARNESKLEHLKQIKATCFIDDSPHQEELLEAGILVLLIDHSYNQNVKGPNVKRFYDWTTINTWLHAFPFDYRIKREKRF
jgi:uncharacterized HAD superfamily protein